MLIYPYETMSFETFYRALFWAYCDQNIYFQNRKHLAQMATLIGYHKKFNDEETYDKLRTAVYSDMAVIDKTHKFEQSEMIEAIESISKKRIWLIRTS